MVKWPGKPMGYSPARSGGKRKSTSPGSAPPCRLRVGGPRGVYMTMREQQPRPISGGAGSLWPVASLRGQMFLAGYRRSTNGLEALHFFSS
jgi:hypothetical protein